MPSWAARNSRNDPLLNGRNQNRKNEARQFSPAELRSFSVIISDVDVTGDYNSPSNNLNEQDAYAKAGVSSYHLKSNSIHRMNGSWKMKPGNGTPMSSDLLDFLSYFANGDGRAIRSENAPVKQKRPLRKILGQEKEGKMESDQIPENQNATDENQQPFQTWQESSRNIPVSSVSHASTENMNTTTVADSSTLVQKGPQEISTTKSPKLAIEVINIDETTKNNTADIENGSANVNNSSNPMNETKVVLHELISTLEEFNKNFEKEETENKPPSKVDIVEKSRVNQTEEGTEMAIHEPGNDDHEMTLHQFKQETESDQTSSTTTATTAKSENKQQVQVDVEMSKSLMQDQNNGMEKEGDVFVENDAAKISGSSNNSNDAGIAHNSSSIAEYHHNEDDGALDGGEEMRRKKRTAKSAFFESTKSTNSNDDNNNATSTSATSLEESTDNANSTQRMKITDPQQTASDLKKLMSLILKSDGNRNGGSGVASSISKISGGDGKSGTQVVNIVITPNQDDESSSNHPQLKNSPQKILFLKTPQVKQMLDIALTDPALSTAAKKIAAALEANPFPNPIPTRIDHNYNNLPSYIVNPNYDDRDQGDDIMQVIGNKNGMMGQQENNDVPATPDGFPLSGNGFLDLHHPNLHFHQALHQMVVNGSKPSNINATTKTNIINIFVINFKEIKEGATGANQQAAGVNQSPLRINIKPSPRPQYHIPKLPFPIKSGVIESLSQTTPNPLAYLDPSLIFNKKMGLAAGGSDEDDENEGAGMSTEKNYEPSKHFDMDRFALSNPDKINIFDLLPGDLGTVTAVQYAPGVDADSTTDTETNKNHNNNNKNTTISHLPLTDIYKHNNSNANAMMMPATMGSYGDYFADFLPDRSREPPGSENIKPFYNENINEHDILSILTSRRPTPTPSSSSSGTGGDHIISSDAKLPPSLAHLEWIFNNQPPPKPQVSEDDIFKRKGETNMDGDIGNGSDSMMEPDETSNSPVYHGSTTQELIEYLLRLQNVSHLPVDSNGISENTTALIDEQLNSTTNPSFMSTNMTNSVDHTGHAQHNLGDGKSSKTNGTISSSINDNGPIVEYTTKSPAFWKFGNKLPLGSFSTSNANTDEALNNRLRKLLTAFGFSALPTLAAGAAATWPYWVPLVATGRRRRRRRSAISALSETEGEDSEIPEIIKRRGQQFLSNLMATAHTTNNRNGTSNSPPPPVHGPSNRQLLSKSTKNSRGEGVNGEQKWIKVDVITATTAHPQPSLSTLPPLSSSSPTSLNFEKMNGHSHDDMNETSFHSQSHNNSLPLNTKNNSDNNSSSLQKHDHQSKTTAMNYVTRHHEDDQNDYAKLKHHHPHEKNDRISLAAQQLDVPLLKNFLKNVLYNELTLTNMNLNTPSPLVFSSSSSSSSPSLLPGNKAQKLRRPPPPTRLPFLSASSPLPSFTPSPYPFLSSTSLRPLSEPVVLTQYPISTSSTLNKLITKNGHHTFKNSQQQQTGGNNKNNNGAILLNTPFFRPSSTPSPSLLLFPEYTNNKEEDDSAEEQQHLIAGSDKKVVSISKFSTPSPTSVYIHNRGDGTTSVMSTQAPSPASLTHSQNNNSLWGSSFGGSGTLSASSIAHPTPDKISSSSSSATTTFGTNTAAVGGHNDDDSLHHFSLSPGQLYDNANNQHNINTDYFLNHFHQSNKRLQKIKLADSIKASERSYTSAALLPLWFPIFFGNHTQLSSKFKQAMRNKMQSQSESF